MIVGGVRMWSGFDPTAEGWALKEVTDLCGLSLGECVAGDLLGSEDAAGAQQAVDQRQHLRLVHG